MLEEHMPLDRDYYVFKVYLNNNNDNMQLEDQFLIHIIGLRKKITKNTNNLLKCIYLGQ